MTEFADDMPFGAADFQNLIAEAGPYVDKTSFLAHLINRGGHAWYLARPRRFGKTLAVSTLECLFSGHRELFKGLAIEKHLDEKRFVPRPVLRLDMSLIDTTAGLPEFREDLAKYTTEQAKRLGVELPSDLSAASALRQLIEELGSSSPRGIAVLIDDYDAPLVDYLDRPDLFEDIHRALGEYYQQLKGLDEHITFLLATGVGRNTHQGMFSGVNHITDVSIDSEYGEMLGFTREELEKHFGPQLEESARSLRMTKGELLEEMRARYGGFSFDGETRVFNPYSALSFFADPNKIPDKPFSNYWFMSGASKTLSQYIRDRRLTAEQFSGSIIFHESARQPCRLDVAEPKSFLYQNGYLSLRPDPAEEEGRGGWSTWDRPPKMFMLDYPNREVRSTMSRLVMGNFLGGESWAEEAGIHLRDALGLGNVGALVKEFNNLFCRFDRVGYLSPPAKSNSAP